MKEEKKIIPDGQASYIPDVVDEASPEVIIRIKNMLGQMTSASQKVASYVMRNFYEVSGMQIQTLASESKTSTATVTRFVHAIGFSGYQEFSLEIARECGRQGKKVTGYGNIDAQSQGMSLYRQVFHSNIQVISDTLKIIKAEDIEKVRDLLIRSRKVILIAQGRSAVVAAGFRQRLRRVGIDCEIFSDPHELRIECTMLRGDEAVMGISAHGRSRTVINGMKQARELNVPTIALTSAMGAPMEKYADIVLMTANSNEKEIGLEPSCTALAQMVLTDCIYVEIYRQNKEQFDSLQEKARRNLYEEMV